MFESVCGPTVVAVQAADPFALAAALARVTEDELGAMSADQAECVVAATQRILNAVSARQSVAFTRCTEHVLDRRDAQRAAREATGERMPVGEPSPVQEAAAGLAPILRVAPRTMVTRIHTAQTLAGLPRTAAMGWAGDLESYRVGVITRAARQVGHEQLSEFEARLHHGDITDLPTSRVKTRASLIAARLMPEPDPADPEQDAPASEAREVRVGPADHAGLTKWDAVLPTEASVSMRAAMETLAAQYRADNPELTVAQSRADALVDLVLSDVQVSTTATLIVSATSAPASEPAPSAEPDPSAQPDPTAEPEPASAADLPAEHAGEPMGTSAGAATHTPRAPACQATDPGQHDPTMADASGATTPRQSDEPTGHTDGGPIVTTSDPEPEPADHRSGRPRRLTPTPCDCASRSESWIDLLAALDRPDVVLAGPWAGNLPDPPVQRRYATAVQQAIEVDANPNLARDWHGQVWFVPKPVTSPPVGLLLPAQVSAILADPDTIIRLGVAHPHTGAVEHLDERTYRPGAKLARLVRARDGTCRYPGCATPAARCDLDHVIAYPHGPTSAANLQTLCRVHHRFKHHGGWTVTMTPEGVCTWTAPNGRSHTTHPHNLHDDAA